MKTFIHQLRLLNGVANRHIKYKTIVLFLSMYAFTFLQIQAQDFVFSEKIDTNFTTQTLTVAKLIETDILMLAQDCTVYNGKTFVPMTKTNFGSVQYFASGTGSELAGTVYVSLETNSKSADLGDGGGIIMFKVQRANAKDAKWVVVPSRVVAGRKVYFSLLNTIPVGGTISNGSMVEYQIGFDGAVEYNLLVTERALPKSNEELATGMTELGDYAIPEALTQKALRTNVVPTGKKLKRYEQMGWVNRIDPVTGIVKNKVYSMGRGGYAHICNAGSIYLTTGRTPSVLFKWERYESINEHGELYFYKEKADGKGEFVSLNRVKKIPNDDDPINPLDSLWQDFDSLLVVEQQALRAGATMFANLEGMAVTELNGVPVLLVAERGIDNSADLFTNKALKYNGTLARHLAKRDTLDGKPDGVITDYHGRILSFTGDAANVTMSVLLEGGAGVGKEGKYVFSNPYEISALRAKFLSTPFAVSQDMILIKENLNGISQGRNPSHIKQINQKINESYWMTPLALNAQADDVLPRSVNDLNLSLIAPRGATLKGNSTILDGSEVNVMFTVINTPNTSNRAPYRRTAVVALRKVNKIVATENVGVEELSDIKSSFFKVWPNPGSNVIHFNKTTDIGVYDVSGSLLHIHQNIDQLEIANLLPGIYFIKNKDSEVVKLLVE